MPDRVTKNISLSPELGAFVEASVETGRYQTASEVVRAGLRLLQEQERRLARRPARKGRPDER